jgi:hypothetical protein
MAEKNEKKRRQLMRQFLSSIISVDISRQFKAKDKFILNLPEKLYIIRTPSSSEPFCPLKDNEQSDIGLLLDLFGENS